MIFTVLPKNWIKLSNAWFKKDCAVRSGAFKYQNKQLYRYTKVNLRLLLDKTVSTSQCPNPCRWLTISERCSILVPVSYWPRFSWRRLVWWLRSGKSWKSKFNLHWWSQLIIQFTLVESINYRLKTLLT